jgi:hypothetical protein
MPDAELYRRLTMQKDAGTEFTRKRSGVTRKAWFKPSRSCLTVWFVPYGQTVKYV